MGIQYSHIQTNFTSGQISPRLVGRVDLAKYANGLRDSKNMIVWPHGGATRRPGTYFVKEVKDSTKPVRLIRFKYSTLQSYVLEIGDGYMRAYRNHALVCETADVITGITQANPGVVTAVAHGYSNGDKVVISGVLGMVQVNNREFTVANVTANTFELGIDTSGYSAYTSGGESAKIFELTTPWTWQEIDDLKFTQSADVLYVCHPDYQTRKLTRTSDTSWTISTLDQIDGPYLAQNTTAITLTPSGSAVGAAITITASSALFATTDVGRHVRIKHGATWGYAKITGFTSSTLVNATVVEAFGATTAQTTWRLGAWSDTTGWPSCVTFYEERLCFGASDSLPQTVWLSVSGDYENFQPSAADGTVSADDGITFTISDDEVNAIRWMSGGSKALVIGTQDGEFTMASGSLTEALTSTNVNVRRQTKHGCAPQFQPVRVGQALLFIQRSLRKLREWLYNFETDGYVAPDLTILSEDITRGGIYEIEYQQEPNSVVWMTRGDGLLVGCTYIKEQEVVAWHLHELGGTFGDGSAFVENICVIPTPDGSADEVWMCVLRTIDGVSRRYVEYMTVEFDANELAIEDAYFVDCGLSYDGAAANTFSGAWHIRGEDVDCLADGAPVEGVSIGSTGAFALSTAASVVHAGFHYPSTIRTLRPEPASGGTAQGHTLQVHKATIRFHESVGCSFGTDDDDLDDIPFREPTNPMDTAIPLFTGDKQILVDKGWDNDNFIQMSQLYPLPMSILCVIFEVEISGSNRP